MHDSGDRLGALTATAPVCGSCGTAFAATAKFCGECGARLLPAAAPAEYKQVTVLFADVVRSMDIAATLDMERLREVMTELVERLAAVARRYGATVDYTGDGVMALFGAPIALEDHAFRACLAALAIHEEMDRLAAAVARSDGVAVQLRVGLNSGRVIAGAIGSGTLGYHATGEHVGMAQRMEAAAPPGGVMLSESTARLVEHRMLLAAREQVCIKGVDAPISARRLLGLAPRNGSLGRAEVSLVGRRWEMAAIGAMIDRAMSGRGGVVNVVGPPGIGKSRTAREAAALAGSHGFEVFWTFCESHASDVPFQVITQLLRVSAGVVDLDAETARARVRAQFPAADPQDLLLLDDALGVADPDEALPAVDPDVRRRRLTALINNATLARTAPAMFIIEDVHWIDGGSESMLADFLSVISRTPSMVLITARPEYEGTLQRVHGAQTIALAPLSDSDTAALLTALLGADPTIDELAAVIGDRADGNPFFAEEMVRELAQRGVLTGEHGDYICLADVADVSVPATVQAAIEARVDRLTASSKRIINAAAVIGARFDSEMLSALGIDPALDELLNAELIDQVRFTPHAEYAFRHPLIRAVAYESQLKSDRAQWHRRLAEAIQARATGAVEEHAGLIAEHLESAGDLHAAHTWHMRAATWATNRDIAIARSSWERASRIAERLPEDDPNRSSMRIAPLTMLCATDWYGRAAQDSGDRFADVQTLCGAAGDDVSLAIAMTGLVTELCYAGRSREASQLASEQMALLESIGDPELTMGLAAAPFVSWFDAGEFGQLLRWTQTVVDLAAGDATKGDRFGFGSPLAIALAYRATARWWLGVPGWRKDIDGALETARNTDATMFAAITCWTYGHAMTYGVVRTDGVVARTSEEALRAEGFSQDLVLHLAQYTVGVALLYGGNAADRPRALDFMARFHDFVSQIGPFLVPVADLWLSRDTVRHGDRDAGIAQMRKSAAELREARRHFYGVWGAGLLVEALLDRDAAGDLTEAQGWIDWVDELRADEDSAVLDITLLRLRALMSRARGDDAYPDLLARYRAMAESLGFEGHIAWAEAMW